MTQLNDTTQALRERLLAGKLRQGTRATSLMLEHARGSASNKRIFFDAPRDCAHN